MTVKAQSLGQAEEQGPSRVQAHKVIAAAPTLGVIACAGRD
jgi:hypothetical protein